MLLYTIAGLKYVFLVEVIEYATSAKFGSQN